MIMPDEQIRIIWDTLAIRIDTLGDGELSFQNCQVIPDLSIFEHFTVIKKIYLRNKGVNDLVIMPIATMPNIDVLDLGNNIAITDSSVRHIFKKTTKVNKLFLDGTSISNTSLIELSKQPIEHLFLSNTKITSESIFYLKNMPLRTLHIDGTEIDDDAIKPLKEIKTLRSFNFGNSKLSTEGVLELQQVIPLCKVTGYTHYQTPLLDTFGTKHSAPKAITDHSSIDNEGLAKKVERLVALALQDDREKRRRKKEKRLAKKNMLLLGNSKDYNETT